MLRWTWSPTEWGAMLEVNASAKEAFELGVVVDAGHVAEGSQQLLAAFGSFADIDNQDPIWLEGLANRIEINGHWEMKAPGDERGGDVDRSSVACEPPGNAVRLEGGDG